MISWRCSGPGPSTPLAFHDKLVGQAVPDPRGGLLGANEHEVITVVGEVNVRLLAAVEARVREALHATSVHADLAHELLEGLPGCPPPVESCPQLADYALFAVARVLWRELDEHVAVERAMRVRS